MKAKITLAGVLFLGAAAGAQENYATWTQHRYVVVNTSASGADVGTLNDFPVLVRLGAADSNVFKQSVGKGADLRFSKVAPGTRLAYHIEAWDSAGRSAAIWVKLDTVNGHTNPVFRMHWGKTGSTDSSNARAVFDTAGGFQAVFHFAETGSDTALDATANNFKAVGRRTGTQPVPSDTAGAIGRGRKFSGGPSTDAPGGEDDGTTGGYYEVLNSAAGPLDVAADGPYTLSAWVSMTSDPSQPFYRMVVSKGDYQYNLMKSSATSGVFEFNPFGDDMGWQVTSAGPIQQETWHHVGAVIYGAGNHAVFLDGVPVVGPAAAYFFGGARDPGFNLHIGRRADHSDNTTAPADNRFWTGLMDEVRIANQARSEDWFKLEYANQRSGQTVVTFSDTIPPVKVLAGGRNRAGASFSARAAGGGAAFEIGGAEGLRARVSLTNLQGAVLWSSPEVRGSRRLEWNGQAGGRPVSPGIYVARVVLFDARDRVAGRLEQRVVLSR